MGVTGSGLSVTNSGTITGGLGGDGVTRANAVTFTGGTNSLTLQAGYSFSGNVVAFSAADTLALGGSGSASFDASAIGASAQYQGFGVFQKTGTSTWTLTGAATTAMTWDVTAGTLTVDGSLAAGTTVTVASGATLDGTGTINGNVILQAGAILGGSLTFGGVTTESELSNLLANQVDGMTIELGADIALTGALPALTKNVTIVGNGHAISNAADASAFTASAGASTLSSLVVEPDYVIQNTATVSQAEDLGIGEVVGVDGHLQILNGGQFSVGNLNLGEASAGNVTVSGTGSVLTVSPFVQAGRSSTADIQVLAGGKISATKTLLGQVTAVTATVSGAGSLWTNTNALNLGFAGSGSLTVTDGGTMAAFDVEFGNGGSSGTLAVNGSLATGRGVVQTGQFIKSGSASAGTIDLDGGILQATATSTDFLSGFGAGDVTLQTGGGFIDTNGFDLTSTAVIDGTGALTKQGAGTLTLSATNTYSGGTTVSAGTLALGDAGALGTGAVSVANGATLDLGGFTATMGALDFANVSGTIQNGTLSASSYTAATGTIGAVMGGSGKFTKTGAGTVTITSADTYTGITDVTAGTLTVNGTLAAGSTVHIRAGATLNGTGTINGNVIVHDGADLSGAGLTIVGTVTRAPDPLLFVTQSGSVRVFSGNPDGTLVSLGNITLASGAFAAAVRGDQAFAYVTVDGPDSVNVIDTSTLAVVQTITTGVNGPNGVVLSPDGTKLYLANHAANTVVVYSVDSTTGQLSAPGTITPGTGPRWLVLKPDGTRLYVVNQSSNDVSVVDTSSNTVVATVPVGSQPVSAAITPDGSKLYVGNGSSQSVSVVDTSTDTVTAILPQGGTPIGIAVSPDGLHYYVSKETLNQIAQYNTSDNSTIAADVTSTTSPAGLAISADGAFLYAADNGNNNLSMWTIDAGTGALTANTPATIATNTNPLFPGIATDGNAMLATGATFVADRAGALATTGSAGAVFTGGTLLVNGANLSFSTPMSLGAGGGTIDTNGNNAAVTSVISGGNALTKAGSGTLTLSGANTFSGGTIVSAGTLALGGAGALGTGTVSVASGATLDLGGFTVNVPTLDFGTGAIGTIQNGTLTSDAYAVQSGTVSLVLGGNGSLTKTGSGSATLSGANTFSGGTTVSAGTLVLGNASALGTGTLSVASGATLDLGGFALALPNLSGSGNFALTSAILTAGSDNTGTTFSGVLSGTGGLTKTGTGNLILTGTNTYVGETTVNAGKLSVNGSLAAGSAVIINSGGFLGGNGTINGDVTIATGGAVAPGNSIGTLSIGGNLTWNGSATPLAFELSNSDNTSDRLAITGAFTKGTGSTFAFDFQGTGRAGATYTLATFGSTTFSAADFSATNLGAGIVGTFSIAGGTLTLTTESFDLGSAQITLGNLVQVYDGTVKTVSATTDPAGLHVDFTYWLNTPNPLHAAVPQAAGSYLVNATVSGRYTGSVTRTLTILPALTTAPVKATVAIGGSATFTAAAGGGGSAVTYQWEKNGVPISGATDASFTVSGVGPADVGFYDVVATAGGVSTTSAPVPLEPTFDGKLAGDGREVGTDIHHPNGNIYDQVLLTGPAVSVKADPGQVTRVSYVDLSDDIVQVEFSGAGVLSVKLANPSGPAAPVNYNQPGMVYMKGHATVTVTGADATTNVAIFTVGRATAIDQSLFRDGVDYDGVADVALVDLASTSGAFGGLFTGDASYADTTGWTGVYAPGVEFTGPVYLEDMSAADSATPVILLGAADEDTRITGGDLLQGNGAPVQVSGITRLQFTDGTDSGGHTLPAQANQARLVEDGVDVTDRLVPAN
ncbi:MAG TPA: autotransporter-associated beta strand repeat-containing protein [Opitutus sp.]|nr:autotransporter-associated beta strand repeat-containing protein [Opitutus sp.]